MSEAILSQILDQLRFLELAELQQLDRAIQDYLADKEEAAKQVKFHQALLTSGLVRQIKKSHHEKQIKRQLIHIQGEPISTTIIEERR